MPRSARACCAACNQPDYRESSPATVGCGRLWGPPQPRENLLAQPELSTPRLLLRPFTAADAGSLQRLANDPAIADGSLTLPHPYPPGLAERWIASHPDYWRQQSAVIFAISERKSRQLLGSISLVLREERQRDRSLWLIGSLGYWLGREFWGRGYMSEAVTTLLAFAFEELGVDCIEAEHHRDNPASGRVLVKSGLQFGELRRHDHERHGAHERCHYRLSWPQYRQWRTRTQDAESSTPGPQAAAAPQV